MVNILVVANQRVFGSFMLKYRLFKFGAKRVLFLHVKSDVRLFAIVVVSSSLKFVLTLVLTFELGFIVLVYTLIIAIL